MFVLLWTACAQQFRDCTEIADRSAALPDRLSETGLFGDDGAVAPYVVPFTPSFPLWSDGSEKQRWMWLPPDAAVDTSDPDAWIFPDGTRFWKEFARGGDRVETRMIERID